MFGTITQKVIAVQHVCAPSIVCVLHRQVQWRAFLPVQDYFHLNRASENNALDLQIMKSLHQRLLQARTARYNQAEEMGNCFQSHIIH
jgi:hypothetical protein